MDRQLASISGRRIATLPTQPSRVPAGPRSSKRDTSGDEWLEAATATDAVVLVIWASVHVTRLLNRGPFERNRSKRAELDLCGSSSMTGRAKTFIWGFGCFDP